MSLHKDLYPDNQKNANKCFFVIKLWLRIVITSSLSSYCTRIVIKENFPLFSLPPGTNKLSKQLIVSVNRLGHVQLKGNLEKKIALMKLEDIFQQEEPIGIKFKDHKKIIKKGFLSDKNCFEIAWWQEKKLLTKTIWC